METLVVLPLLSEGRYSASSSFSLFLMQSVTQLGVTILMVSWCFRAHSYFACRRFVNFISHLVILKENGCSLRFNIKSANQCQLLGPAGLAQNVQLLIRIVFNIKPHFYKLMDTLYLYMQNITFPTIAYQGVTSSFYKLSHSNLKTSS